MFKGLLLSIVAFSMPFAVLAEATSSQILPSKVFSAEVIKIIDEQEVKGKDGNSFVQQDVELKGLDGKHKDWRVVHKGIGEPEAPAGHVFKPGDRVLVEASTDEFGNTRYAITDYIRTSSLMWLAIAFVAAILAVGRFKGLRSLASLTITFVIIMKYVLPQIMDGSDPVIVTIIGSFAILLAIIYVTEGFKAVGHISVLSIFFSLLLTVALSWFFVELAKLSGLANEEASFLVGYGGQIANFKGLLLAGMIIGTLGVLDDVVISQVTAVEEIHKAGPGQTRAEVFKKAMNVGVSHISSMTNTLFLAYAGASLPLLILFLSGQSAFSSPFDALNNEALATEVVRTLSGSIGLVLAMPISTLLAVWWIKKK